MATGEWKPRVLSGNAKHPLPKDTRINYGTAGFRAKADILDHIVYRMGILAALRSKYKKGQSIGLVITASHNPEEDNGVKLVDPMGEMLEMSWETWATKIANSSNEALCGTIQELIDEEKICMDVKASVALGRDTRCSGPSLQQAATDGLLAVDSAVHDYGIVTTPQLHFMVRCLNQASYGTPTVEGYRKKIVDAFLKLHSINGSNAKAYKPTVIVDAANGVGGPQMKGLIPMLSSALKVQLVNEGSSGKLNYMCGADYVKTQQKAPEGMTIEIGQRCASFDGDADRIVYYFKNKDGNFMLLDGDKIAILVAGFLHNLTTKANLNLNVGLVQTAYANGSSTRYITDHLKMPVACVPTGVKHLHHKAGEFDIGVYFEANGHGTVLFSEEAEKCINEAAAKSETAGEVGSHVIQLQAAVNLINQTVGDAISDMLLVEAILHSSDWDVNEWSSMYKDLPNRQLKVKVADRTVISTTDAERKAVTPAGLQSSIDELVSKYNNGRSFTRPSGTEDIVRVYAEAATQKDADTLAHEVSLAVFDLAGGVGDRPT